MRKIIIILFLFSFQLNTFSQEIEMINKENFLDKIEQISNNTKSISADFTQEKTVSYLKEIIETSGKFYTQTGNMRWEQQKPYSYIMLLSEEGVKIKDDGNEKAYNSMADKFMQQIRNILMSSINGSFANNKDFNSTYYENNKFYIVKLEPKNRRLSKMFNAVHLSFDKTTYRLKTLTFVEDNGKSDMHFYNEEFNKSIEQSIFQNF